MDDDIWIEEQHIAAMGTGKPWLLALAKPMFSELAINRVPGKRSRTIAALSSVEALSTTISSTRSPSLASTTVRSVCSRKLRTL